MANNNTLKSVLEGLGYSLIPFRDAVSSQDSFIALLYQLGWDVDNMPSAYTTIGNNIDTLINDIEALPNNPDYSAILSLLNSISNIYNSLQSAPAPIGVNSFSQFYSLLFNKLVINNISLKNPELYTFLLTSKVISHEYVAATYTNVGYYKNNFDLNKLFDFIANPLSVILDLVSWNNSNYTYKNILYYIFDALSALKINARIIGLDQETGDAYFPTYFQNEFIVLESDIAYINSIHQPIKLKLIQYEDNTTLQSGIIVHLELPSNITVNQQINDNLALSLNVNSVIGNAFGFIITPIGISFKYPFQSASTFPTLGINMSLMFSPSEPILIFGRQDSTRLELQGSSLTLGAVEKGSNNIELILDAGLDGLRLIIDPNDSDGFISKILGSTVKELNSSLGIRWSSETGIHFSGSGGFEVNLPGNFDIGAIHINDLVAGLYADTANNTVSAKIGANIIADLGPITVEIDNIGLALNLHTNGGNAGPFGIDLGFKPPSGVGLTVDAKGVTGGGYIYLDYNQGRYYGALELSVLDKFNVSAIGIVTTKMPDGSKGYSMLLLLNVDFNPGIPVGFGFSITGLGGLAGVNRDFNPAPLQAGVTNGSINEIMFPTNVVENIDHFIADLDSYFPAKQERYTFGLFFMLEWGEGEVSLIRIKMGLLLNFPDPVRLAILGDVKVGLPSIDDPLLQVNVSFIGVIDFDNKYITFDAAIYDSHLLSFDLSGEIAVRVFWGKYKEVLLSIGGFHPAFHPPGYLMLPADINQHRLTISVINTSFLLLRLQSYFAFTSNTVQFGAHVTAKLDIDVARLEGDFGFDVLFQFNPFHIDADGYSHLAVYVCGCEVCCIDMQVHLTGPGPWHAIGHGSFTLGSGWFSWTVHVDLDETWGDTPPQIPPPGFAVGNLLNQSLNDNKNWQTIMPDTASFLETIRIADSSQLVLHPLGTLSIVEKAVPLGIQIDRYGTQLPSDGNRFDITEVNIAGNNYTNLAHTLDSYAPAQFFNMSDKEKLAATSFEYLPSGIQITDSFTQFPQNFSPVEKDLQYEVIIVDFDARMQLSALQGVSQNLANNFVPGGVISANGAIQTRTNAVNKPAAFTSRNTERYKIVGTDSLTQMPNSTVHNSLAEALTTVNGLGATSGFFKAVPSYYQ